MARKPKKTLVLQDYLNNNAGKIHTVQELATIAQCTIQNVYVFIRTNPAMFNSLGKGRYQINAMQDSSYLNNNIDLD